eukprot:15901127-Heterocapsa_arctica.AAC.1
MLNFSKVARAREPPGRKPSGRTGRIVRFPPRWKSRRCLKSPPCRQLDRPPRGLRVAWHRQLDRPPRGHACRKWPELAGPRIGASSSVYTVSYMPSSGLQEDPELKRAAMVRVSSDTINTFTYRLSIQAAELAGDLTLTVRRRGFENEL